MTRIACLHGHHSNIPLLDDAFSPRNVELVHFVDPGLLMQNGGTRPPTQEQVHEKLRSQLSWMQACLPDAIVITCTQYAASLTAEDEASMNIPVFTIDGPFFDEVTKCTGPQALLFSNPATVTPTMNRLWKHASARGLAPQIEIHLADGAFDFIMANKQQAYHDAIWDALQTLCDNHLSASLAVAQLSMVPVAHHFTRESGIPIIHPLQSLTERIVQTLQLSHK
ncbi:hypothetical protein [Brevibacillus choshinensis]|uniref:hypothetical protein n=1 Tax=Brevibacillus choshinensis TaxID=54911 RepID=UPI002E1FF5B8|nr:hypothetical protein [Brevibacillus choshinensis]